MRFIKKVKSISIWIFLIPFITVNTCLILITEFQWVFPNQEDIIHNTFPYFDGGAYKIKAVDNAAISANF